MDKTILLNGFKLNMDYSMQLIADVDEADMMKQPNGCLLHHAWHIGQLAEWRRMMGYNSALKKLMTSRSTDFPDEKKLPR